MLSTDWVSCNLFLSTNDDGIFPPSILRLLMSGHPMYKVLLGKGARNLLSMTLQSSIYELHFLYSIEIETVTIFAPKVIRKPNYEWSLVALRTEGIFALVLMLLINWIFLFIVHYLWVLCLHACSVTAILLFCNRYMWQLITRVHSISVIHLKVFYLLLVPQWGKRFIHII